jgi:hypothetical protein
MNKIIDMNGKKLKERVDYSLLKQRVKVKKVNLFLCLIKHYAMKMYRGVDV